MDNMEEQQERAERHPHKNDMSHHQHRIQGSSHRIPSMHSTHDNASRYVTTSNPMSLLNNADGGALFDAASVASVSATSSYTSHNNDSLDGDMPSSGSRPLTDDLLENTLTHSNVSSPSDDLNEAPLSMSDSSVSPPLESASQTIIAQGDHSHRIVSPPPCSRPSLARVSSDPSGGLLPRSLPLPIPTPRSRPSAPSTPLLFQNQPAPIALPSGNRPAGVALPTNPNYSNMSSHHHHHHQPTAGPSSSSSSNNRRSTRYADPDSHWLSEDEGEAYVEDIRRNRQAIRRRGGGAARYNANPEHFRYPPDGTDDRDRTSQGKNLASPLEAGHLDDDDNEEYKQSVDSRQSQEDLYIDSAVASVDGSHLTATATATDPHSRTTTPHSHDARQRTFSDPARHSQSHRYQQDRDSIRRAQINHKPATVKPSYDPLTNFKDYAPFIKDLSTITPSLLKSLQCPSCGQIMNDPTTLACGHSICLLCVDPKAASVLLRKRSPTAPPIALTAAVFNDEITHQHSSILPPTPVLPKAAFADGTCPIPTCKKVTKAMSNGRQGLRIDVVLQKIAVLLKSRVALEQQEEEEEGDLLDNDDYLARTIGESALLSSSHGRDTLSRSFSNMDRGEIDGDVGSLSEPIISITAHQNASLRRGNLSRSRSQSYRSNSAGAGEGRSGNSSGNNASREDNGSSSYGSNPSSPDEETKSEDNTKRGMKSRRNNLSGGSTRSGAKKSRNQGSTTFPSNHGPMNLTFKQQHRFEQHEQHEHEKYAAGMPQLVTDVLGELECHICVTLIYEPLTTPCGHTFCRKCLLRSLDHSTRCPLCRSDLPGMTFFSSAPINFTLSNLLITTFPVLYEQRKDLSLQEEEESGLDTPIFICMVAFPNMPTNLHIYEPRYRLMMRRAMDTNKRFGMVLPSRTAGAGGFSKFGTLLEIKNLHTFDDGRSMIETVGVGRFKILESGTVDGYTVGKIERIDDIAEEEELELERLALLRGAGSNNAQQQQEANPSGLQHSSNTPASQTSEKAMSPSATATPSTATATAAPAPSRPISGLRSFSSFTRQRRSSSTNTAQPASSSSSMCPAPLPQSSGNATTHSASGGPSASATATTAPQSDPQQQELSNAQLIEICRGFVDALRTGSTPWLLQRLNSSLPPMPDDPREFTWWMAMLMPVDDHEKAKLLQTAPQITCLLDPTNATFLVVQPRMYNLLEGIARHPVLATSTGEVS